MIESVSTAIVIIEVKAQDDSDDEARHTFAMDNTFQDMLGN
jgi:hypothetical protein